MKRAGVAAFIVGFLLVQQSRGMPASPVVIDYFYEPGCPACLRIKNEILPDLRMRYDGLYRLNHHDMRDRSSVVRLIAYQDALGVTNNSPVSMFLDYEAPLFGLKSIRHGLLQGVDTRIGRRQEQGWTAPVPIVLSVPDSITNVEDRAGSFAVPAVLLAGAIDGINPCAISTLVLLMSLLVVSSLRGRGLLLMGGAFCVATFVTYTAIGFGLLSGLHVLESFPVLRTIFESVLASLLLVLAFLSFRDAIRYQRTHDPSRVSVQLPDKIKRSIHRVLHKGARSHHLVLAGLGCGAAVTALEAVCTGQVYLPTMTLVIREKGDLRVWGLLLLYNTMFILPLVLAMVLTRYGLSTERMLALSRKNVPVSKTLLGLFFVGVAVYLLV